MAAVAQPSNSMNDDIRFTIGADDGQESSADAESLEKEVLLLLSPVLCTSKKCKEELRQHQLCLFHCAVQ